jgi:hypothetical protein
MKADTHDLEPKALSEIIRLSYVIRHARSVLTAALTHLYVLAQLQGLHAGERSLTRRRRPIRPRA